MERVAVPLAIAADAIIRREASIALSKAADAPEPCDDFAAVVVGPVIDDEDVEIRVGLRGRALNGIAEKVGVVEAGNGNRDERSVYDSNRPMQCSIVSFHNCVCFQALYCDGPGRLSAKASCPRLCLPRR